MRIARETAGPFLGSAFCLFEMTIQELFSQVLRVAAQVEKTNDVPLKIHRNAQAVFVGKRNGICDAEFELRELPDDGLSDASIAESISFIL